MGRNCTVCVHPQRAEIDRAIVIARIPYRSIADQFGVSVAALLRHSEAHILATLRRAQDAERVADADALLDQVRDLYVHARDLLEMATATRQIDSALRGIRESARVLELLAKLRGELRDNPTLNLYISGEWGAVRGTIVAALAPYPQARIAVADALARLPAPSLRAASGDAE